MALAIPSQAFGDVQRSIRQKRAGGQTTTPRESRLAWQAYWDVRAAREAQSRELSLRERSLTANIKAQKQQMKDERDAARVSGIGELATTGIMGAQVLKGTSLGAKVGLGSATGAAPKATTAATGAAPSVAGGAAAGASIAPAAGMAATPGAAALTPASAGLAAPAAGTGAQAVGGGFGTTAAGLAGPAAIGGAAGFLGSELGEAVFGNDAGEVGGGIIGGAAAGAMVGGPIGAIVGGVVGGVVGAVKAIKD